MKVIEIAMDSKDMLCEKLKRAKMAIEQLESEMKEASYDTRMWEARGTYGDDYRDRDRRYRDDFRYR